MSLNGGEQNFESGNGGGQSPPDIGAFSAFMNEFQNCFTNDFIGGIHKAAVFVGTGSELADTPKPIPTAERENLTYAAKVAGIDSVINNSKNPGIQIKFRDGIVI